MKYLTTFRFIKWHKGLISLIFIAFLTLSQCHKDPVLWKPNSAELVAGDYIDRDPQFSEFSKLIEKADLSAFLKIRGPFTIFLPNNDAMHAFYAEKNVQSLDDFDKDYLIALASNHIIPDNVPTSDIGLGAIRGLNLLGDKMVTEFYNQDIIVNKVAKIIKRDVPLANGFIHQVDKVLEPIVDDIYTAVSSNPSYHIFSEGLRITGIKDTLQLISFPFGKKTARTQFTLLAVPDTIFNRYGINSVNDLITWCGANPSDDLTQMENPFYRFIEYHCMNGIYFLSDFNTGIYSILSHDNNISMTISDDYKLNFNSKTMKYTGFIISESDYPAKNGTFHTINDILPVVLPEPATITFETTDYFDLKQGDYYGKYYARWFDGQNSFEKIKFGGDYLLYYYKVNTGRTPLINNDCLSMLGFWWIEITTPKIMKGKYDVSANIWSGGEDLPIFAAYIDDVYYVTINARISNASMLFGTVKWDKTEEHKIRLVCKGWGVVFWDSVIFTPVKN